MSSIFGAWQLTKKPFSPTNIQQVIKQTAWWQPDKLGHYHQQHIFLGHQLLATKPNHLKETQPYQDALAQLHIVADVRLDNRSELLGLLGIVNKDLPDYVLILVAYKKFGKDCVKHLIGAFAFVIWDEKKQELFCARDQMGVKPFFYYFKHQLFAFGSQKKSILSLDDIDKTANWRNIFNKISDIGVPPNSTEQLHIQILPPAHYAMINANGIKINRYWELDIHQTTTYQKEADYIEQFRVLFKQAIQDRLICHQSVGTHLSGGLDSSGITAVADELTKQKGQALHVFGYSVPRDYQADNMDRVEENLLAFDVVDHCQLKHFHNVYTPIKRSFHEIILDETQTCDGIAQSNNVYTEYELQADAQAKGVEVLLSGFPGDELVTSFSRSYYLEYLEQGRLGAYFFKKAKSRHGVKIKIKELFAAKMTDWLPSHADQLRAWFIERREKEKHYVANGWAINKSYFQDHPEQAAVLEKQLYRKFPAPISLKAAQRNHVCRPHTSRRMVSENMAGLRFKVEHRFPMADIRLLQYVLSVPVDLKIAPDMTRRLYRLGMKGYLPDSIRLRDMKYKGSLKTTHLIEPRDRKEPSKKDLWEHIQTHQAAPFLNEELVGKYFQSKRSPYGLKNWMIIAQLGVENKLTF